MRLLIISNMDHYLRDGRVVGAWDAAVREIDALSELFDEVRHLAVLRSGIVPKQARSYESSRVRLVPMPPSGGPRLRDKLEVAARLPAAAWRIRRELASADAVHVRTPASIAYAALPLMALTRRAPRRWIKYAGDWRPRGRDPISFRLQRFLLRRFSPEARVSVNGYWQNAASHVVSFPNPSFSITEAREAAARTAFKQLTTPVRLLFVGRLHAAKGAARAIDIVAGLREQGIEARLDIAGDGPERERLEVQARQDGLSGQVRIHGWLGRTSLNDLYRGAHFVTLPSSGAEGWPKALSEGMAYRAVPLAGAVGGVASVLRRKRAGLALPSEDVRAWVGAIANIVRSPERWIELADGAQTAAADFTYEVYLERVREILDLRRRPAATEHQPDVPHEGNVLSRIRRWKGETLMEACS